MAGLSGGIFLGMGEMYLSACFNDGKRKRGISWRIYRRKCRYACRFLRDGRDFFRRNRPDRKSSDWSGCHWNWSATGELWARNPERILWCKRRAGVWLCVSLSRNEQSITGSRQSHTDQKRQGDDSSDGWKIYRSGLQDAVSPRMEWCGCLHSGKCRTAAWSFLENGRKEINW